MLFLISIWLHISVLVSTRKWGNQTIGLENCIALRKHLVWEQRAMRRNLSTQKMQCWGQCGRMLCDNMELLAYANERSRFFSLLPRAFNISSSAAIVETNRQRGEMYDKTGTRPSQTGTSTSISKRQWQLQSIRAGSNSKFDVRQIKGYSLESSVTAQEPRWYLSKKQTNKKWSSIVVDIY